MTDLTYPPEGVYEIRVHGHLEPRWARWFEGMQINLLDDGDTLITGAIPDQSALHGLLSRIRDLGLTLVSLQKK